MLCLKVIYCFCRVPSTHSLEQGCQTKFPGGRSVCRFLCFPFNQLSIKACIPRCVYSLTNQLLEFTKGAKNNPKTSRHSGPPGLEFDTCALEIQTYNLLCFFTLILACSLFVCLFVCLFGFDLCYSRPGLSDWGGNLGKSSLGQGRGGPSESLDFFFW